MGRKAGGPGRTDKLNGKARLKTQPHENQTKLDISKVQKLGNAALDCWWLVGHCEMEIKLNDTDRMLASGGLGHDGLFDQQLAPSLNQIATMRRALVDAKIQEYGLRGGIDLCCRVAAEEVLAEMAQTTPKLHFVQRAIAAIRSWLRQHVPGFRSLALSDAEIIRDYILPACAFVERGGPGDGQRVEPSFSRSAMKSVDANIARGSEAMNKAILEKAAQHRAMHRAGLGWVDFVWGDDKRGIAHILAQRQAKDGMTRQEAIQLLEGLVSLLGASASRL